MRWPRAGIAVGLIGLVLLGAGSWLGAAGAAGPVRQDRVSAIRRPPPALLHQLQQWLAGHRPVPGRRFAPRSLAPNGGTCPVAAGGFCSLTPCVVFAGRPTATVASPQAVVRAQPAPGAVSCRGHSAPPRTVPVAAF